MESKQLELVKDQAEQKKKQLSERFEQAVNFVHNERQQLMQLKEYEAGYLDKIKNEEHLWSADNSIRYRQFCTQLSQTIEAQQRKLNMAEEQLTGMRASLSQQQQKINVLDDLIEREQLEAAHLYDKKIQKEMDDLSNRRYGANPI